MKLVTDFTVYKDDVNSEHREHYIESLVKCVEAFGTCSRCAICWNHDISDPPPKRIFIIEGMGGDIFGGRTVARNRLKEAFLNWAQRLADWCENDGDEDVDTPFEHKTLKVVITDNDMYGGTTIQCYDKDNCKDHMIAFAPDLDEEEKEEK